MNRSSNLEDILTHCVIYFPTKHILARKKLDDLFIFKSNVVYSVLHPNIECQKTCRLPTADKEHSNVAWCVLCDESSQSDPKHIQCYAFNQSLLTMAKGADENVFRFGEFSMSQKGSLAGSLQLPQNCICNQMWHDNARSDLYFLDINGHNIRRKLIFPMLNPHRSFR